MKFTIPYSSKIPNPNAGNTQYIVPGHIRYTILASEPIYEGCTACLSAYTNQYEYVVDAEDKFLYILRKYSSIILKATRIQDIQYLHTLSPEGAFLYKYGDCEVTCEACRDSFDWKELKEDYVDDIDTYSHSNCICPKCGCWDCCKLEFQK